MRAFTEFPMHQRRLRESDSIQGESNLTHQMVPVGGVNRPFNKRGRPKRQHWLGVSAMAFVTRVRTSSGLQFAFPSGRGSERSHNGFRDHSHSEQHPTGGVHLFRRDSDLAGLEKLLGVHLSYLRSEICARRLGLRFEICDLRYAPSAFMRSET